MEYYNPQEISENKELIKKELNEEASWATKKDVGINLVNKYAKNKEAVILDSGCGAGLFSIKMSQAGYKNYWLADIDDYLAQEDLRGRFKKSDFSFEPLQFSDGFFDMVVSFQVIEHLENQFFYIRESARVLKKGGVLLISMPNPYNFRNRLEYFFRCNLIDFRLNNNHISFMTKDIFKKTFEKYFTIEQVIFAGYSIPYKVRFLSKIFKSNEYTGAKVMYVLRRKN